MNDQVNDDGVGDGKWLNEPCSRGESRVRLNVSRVHYTNDWVGGRVPIYSLFVAFLHPGDMFLSFFRDNYTISQHIHSAQEHYTL